MQSRTHSEVRHNDLELWTLDDAEAWMEAEQCADAETWLDDDHLLDNDLWMDADVGGELSLESLSRLGIRVS